MDTFKDFVIDQLQRIRGLECRRMFGGYGLYANSRFFGILFKGRLYFKTTESTREKYIRAGMKPFRPNAKQTLKNYFEIPVDVLKDHKTHQCQ